MLTALPAPFMDRNLNLDVRDLRLSGSVAVDGQAHALHQLGHKVVRLDTARSPFPIPDVLVESLEASTRKKDDLPGHGLPELKAAVASYHRRRLGLVRTAQDILIGPGSKELVFLLMLAYYGELLVPAPGWASYGRQAEILERHVRRLPTYAANNWQVTPADLGRACASDPEKPRILILNYPSNVTGATYSAEDLAALAAAARRLGLIVLSDEMLGELHYTDQHVSLARFYPEGTIVSGGPSEFCGAGAWHLGIFSFPGELRWLEEAMADVAGETYTPVSTAVQWAAVRAYSGDEEIERYLTQCRRILAALGDFAAHQLQSAGLSVCPPHGGLCLFCDFTPVGQELHRRGIQTSLELSTRLLRDTGIAVLPGSDFGLPPGQLGARLAYVAFDGGRALEAAEALSDEGIGLRIPGDLLRGDSLRDPAPLSLGRRRAGDDPLAATPVAHRRAPRRGGLEQGSSSLPIGELLPPVFRQSIRNRRE